jgi:transposase
MSFPKGQKRDFAGLEQRRWRGKQLLADGLTPAEVARRLGVSAQSVCRWRDTAPGALRHRRAGRPAALSAAQLARVRQAVLAGPQAHGFRTNLWTCQRAAQVVAQLTGRRFHRSHVWRLLGQLGFSCQKPVGRARERDEAAIAEWKNSTWPALKKRPGAKAARSSSSTKAD